MRVATLLVGPVVAVVLGAAQQARAQAAAAYGMASAASATSTSSVASVYGQRLNTHRNTHRSVQGTISGKTYRPGAVTATHRASHQKDIRGTVAVTGQGPQSGRAVSGASPAARTLGTSASGLTVVGAEPRVGAEPQ